VEELKILTEKAIKDVKTKIDSQDFDDEIRHLTACISSID